MTTPSTEPPRSEDLINRLAESKNLYDEALFQALDRLGDNGKPISEEKAKLLARRAVRQAGKEEPEVVRWRLWEALHPPAYFDRDLTTEPRL